MKKLDPKLSQRACTLRAFSDILDQGHSLEQAWNTAKRAAPEQAVAWSRHLLLATLRQMGPVDAWLRAQLRQPLSNQYAPVMHVLRLGVVQLQNMGEPPHAVVNEMVELTKQIGFESHAGLVNAVLKKASKLEEGYIVSQPDSLWLPKWWKKNGVSDKGIAQCLSRDKPPLDLCVKADEAQWAEKLGGEVVHAQTIRLHAYEDVTQLEGFADGAWWVQDVAASIPVELLGDVSGKHVLDLCAAPGGKTAQLCSAGAQVVALDRSGKRLNRLKENMQRLKLAPEIIEADALTWKPEQLFDAILLDAPCSATGTIRRNPDIVWNRKPEDIPSLITLQRDLLAKAKTWLKPGGVLVYAVCSLLPDEGEQQLAYAQSIGLKLLPATHSFANAEGVVRTHPSQLVEQGGMDGFFAAAFTVAD